MIPAAAGASEYAMYAFWAAETPMTEYEQRVIVADESRTTFRASFWHTDKGIDENNRYLESGYIGIQSRSRRDAARGRPQSIRFSVWNSTAGEPGDEGTECVPFGGEGTGYTCAIFGEGLWTVGVSYALRAKIEDGWIYGSVSGEDGLDLRLGRLRAPAGQTSLGRTTTAFVENWTMRCRDAPRASALFYAPVSGAGYPSPRRARAPHPQCYPAAKGPVDGGVYIVIGGDDADRERVALFLESPEHAPLTSRPWFRALIDRMRADRE